MNLAIRRDGWIAGMVFRNVLRWIILAAGTAVVTWLLWGVWTNFLGWRANARTDPSVAELYSDGCFIDGGLAAGALGVTLGSFLLLKPQAGAGGPE